MMTDHKIDFAARLNDAMDAKNMPDRGRAADMAKKFSVTPKGAGKWIKGEAIPEIGTLIEISEWLGVEINWLLTGKSSSIIATQFDSNVDIKSIEPVTYAPVISWVQAGSMTDMESIENLSECEMIPLVPGAGKRSFYLKVRGLSNAPHFEEGEKICIDPDWNLSDIQTGEMVVVRCDGMATFKALICEPDGYYLKPLNPNWSEQVIPLSENCVLVGKYVGSFRPPRKFTLA